jgi:hypothetical protein
MTAAMLVLEPIFEADLCDARADKWAQLASSGIIVRANVEDFS